MSVLLLVVVSCVSTPSETDAASYTSIAMPAVVVEVGTTAQLTIPAGLSAGTFTWQSSATAIAQVSGSGLVTGVTPGQAEITAKSKRHRVTYAVTVPAPEPPVLTTVEVTPVTATVQVGASTQLAALAKDQYGNALSGATFTWATANPAIATVSSSGLVWGVAAGQVTVTVTVSGRSATSQITVDATPPPSEPAGFFVAPNGNASGDGTLARPWDLATALNHPLAVRPGAEIWLRGGTYHGTFASNLKGTAAAPIVVRQYPGERATIDAGALSETAGALTVRGEWTHFRDLELMSSALHRNSSRPHGLLVYASNTKFINLVIHDVGVAIYTADDRTSVEIYGCIIYNNGWETTRGHGHAVYIKNSVGNKLVRDNITFNQFGYGLHGYTNLGSGRLNGLTFDGNVSFNNGSLSADPSNNTANLLLGGQEPVEHGQVTNNMTYFSSGVRAYNVVLGWSSASSRDITVTGNYIVGGNHSLKVWEFEQTNISGNESHTPYRHVHVEDTTLAGHNWSNNRYFHDPLAQAWRHHTTYYDFSLWQSTTRLDAGSQAVSGAPTAARVFVRPNAYEPGRATVVVYNWERQGSIPANLSGVLHAGDNYEVHNVQDFFGAPVARGTYTGDAITLPLTGVAPAQPIGGSPSAPPRTGPEFDVFVVRRVGK